MITLHLTRFHIVSRHHHTQFVKFIAKKRAKKNKKQNMWERLTKAP